MFLIWTNLKQLIEIKIRILQKSQETIQPDLLIKKKPNSTEVYLTLKWRISQHDIRHNPVGLT